MWAIGIRDISAAVAAAKISYLSPSKTTRSGRRSFKAFAHPITPRPIDLEMAIGESSS